MIIKILLFIYGYCALLLGIMDFFVKKLRFNGNFDYLWQKLTLKYPKNSGKQPIWLHAVSLGESISILDLLKKWHEAQPDAHFIISVHTSTAYNFWHKLQLSYCNYCFVPFDTNFLVRRWLNHVKPKHLFIVENELWPHLIHESAQFGCKISLINGRISQKSLNRWLKFPQIRQFLCKNFGLVLAQSFYDQQRLTQFGFNRVQYCGNLKFMGQKKPCNLAVIADLTQLCAERPKIAFTSTHKGEEQLAIANHIKMHHHFPNFLTIIAPRHPQRIHEILKILTAHGLSYFRTDTRQGALYPDILMVNEFGKLSEIYAICDIAVIGGSFTVHGGHNPIEAFDEACMVVHGANVENFQKIYADANQLGIALSCDNGEIYETCMLAWQKYPQIAPKLMTEFRESHQEAYEEILKLCQEAIA